MPAIAETVRSLRIIHFVFSVSIFLYLIAGEEIVRPTRQVVHASMHYGFVIAAGGFVAVAALFQEITSGKAAEELRQNPDDARAIERWRSAQIVSYVLFEAVALLGLALRFLGDSFGWALPFYAASVLFLAIYRPADPR